MTPLFDSKRSRCIRCCSNEAGLRHLGSARQALRLDLRHAVAKVSPAVGKPTARQLQPLLQ